MNVNHKRTEAPQAHPTQPENWDSVFEAVFGDPDDTRMVMSVQDVLIKMQQQELKPNTVKADVTYRSVREALSKRVKAGTFFKHEAECGTAYTHVPDVSVTMSRV